MVTITSVLGMQRRAGDWRRRGIRIGLVPTMGALHEGHLSLVKRARREVGPQGRVVVSIFVNPTQFGPGEDFGRYPRDLAADRKLCRAAGVDVIFAPTAASMYPGAGQSGGFSTYVEEQGLSRLMEGEHRPAHFRGVTTVVAKLFHLVLADVAVFGAKDYQQAAVVRRMVRDLNMPVRLVVAPTLRHRDGLALSSRNRYLQGEDRQRALVLWQSLCRVRRLVRGSSRGLSASDLQRRVGSWVKEAGPGTTRLDYVAFFHPATLEPVRIVKRGAHMALAVRVGRTRLIDNGRI